jgi:S1-C subfamily serine protease
MTELRALFSTLVTLAVIAVVASRLPWTASTDTISPASSPALSAASTLPSIAEVATATPPAAPKKSASARAIAPESSIATSVPAIAERVPDAYDTPPLPFETVNADARAALVNIYCTPRGGSLNPISGSGVIIDPRGVILTNAHVAQYVLLSETPLVDLSCVVRMGAPAYPRYTPQVIAISPEWVAAHAAEIKEHHRLGTGEHDWALLRLVPLTANPTPLPDFFPYLAPDTRPTIGFVDDQILAAGYPAEFVGGIIAQNGLYPVSSVSTIDALLTFATGSVDLFSIGSVIEAQGGSSGGPVVNQWDKLIGIITTTSDGTTTAARSARAITLDYINADVTRETGKDLAAFLDADLDSIRAAFVEHESGLIASYIAALRH